MISVPQSKEIVEADVIVVGAGIIGAFSALRLAQRGKSVYLLDKGAFAREASGRNGGGVRQQFRDPNETPLAMEAVKIWQGLKLEFGEEVEYIRHGSLRLIRSDKEAQLAQNCLDREKKLGLEVTWLNPKELRERIPQLSPDLDLSGGTLCHTDGTANPLLVARSLERTLIKAGVNLRLHEPVRRILASGGRVAAVQTDSAEYRGSAVINTSGPWAQGLCQTLGLTFPVVFRKSQIVLTEALPPTIKGFVSFENGYLRQALDGNLHLGVRGLETDFENNNPSLRALMHVGSFYPEYFPFLRNINLIRSFAGITTWTPDQIPIIDTAPGLDGFYLATGFSGHGFCLGPLIGRLLTEWIVDGQCSMDLSPFKWTRFGRNKIEIAPAKGAMT